MPLTREESRKELLELHLPAAVLSIFDGQSPHPAFSYRCEAPHYIFSTPVELDGVHITPLWELGICITAYQHSLPKGRFVSFSLEDKQLEVFGSSFQTLAAALLIKLWEDEESADDLREAAHLLEFKQFDWLLSECASRLRSENYAEYKAWHTRIMEFCENAV